MDNIALKRQTGLLILMAVGGFAALFYAMESDVQPAPVAKRGESIAVSVVAHAGRDTIVNSVVEGRPPVTVLLALEMAAGKHRHSVGIREYSFGKLVKSIGPYVSGRGGDWRFTINGEFQKTGAGSLTLRAGDLVTWSYGAQAADSL